MFEPYLEVNAFLKRHLAVYGKEAIFTPLLGEEKVVVLETSWGRFEGEGETLLEAKLNAIANAEKNENNSHSISRNIFLN